MAANVPQASVPKVTWGHPSAGVVTLLSDYEVCKEGDVLTPEQARVLVSLALQRSGRGTAASVWPALLIMFILPLGSLWLLQKLFGYEMAEFKVTIKYMWDSQSGRVQQMGDDDLPDSAPESSEESESDGEDD